MIRDSARSGSFDREQFARLRAAERCRHSDRKERSALSPDHGCRSCHRTNRQWSRTQIAEMTESYLGVNDFYPFVRGELKEHDPETFALMAKIWGKI